MNSDIERDDTYVEQLYQVFKSCDIYGTGLLGENELFNLCMRLQLDDNQTNYIITNLIGNDLIAKINFDDFKEIFVLLLTQTETNSEEHYSQINSNEEKSVSYNSKQLNNNNIQDMNTEKYLKSIWDRLGVGGNGYLNIEELFRVCEHIGMNGINSEIIEQLFDKLDSDQDGRVSFDEFLEGLFQHDSAVCDTSVNNFNNLMQLQTESAHGPSAPEADITSHTNCINLNDSQSERHDNSNELLSEHNSTFYTNIGSSYLSTLDLDRNGYTEAENVVKLWESLGFTNSEQLLISLGLNPKLKVNLHELSTVLEEKLCSPDTTNPELFQISLATFQNELTQTKINYDRVRDEKDRLRISICEANIRADLLAQEVDDHNAKLEASSQSKLILLEKKYNEQIRALQEELQRERETMDKQSLHMREDISKELATAQELSAQLRETIVTLEQENKRLESEVQSLNIKNFELQKAFIDSHKRVDETDMLKKRLTELESMQSLVDEQQSEQIDSLKAQNKEIQDQNDELLLHIENLKQQLQQFSIHCRNKTSKFHKRRTNHRRSQSWLSDCTQSFSSVEELANSTHNKSVATFNLKKRGNDLTSSDETEDEECSPNSRTKKMVLSAKSHSDLDNSLNTEYEETMSENNEFVSEDTLLKEINRLNHQLSAQIGRTDQLIVDRNKTVLQIQQFYEKALHNKDIDLKEQTQLNSNLNARLKEVEERYINQINGYKQYLCKQFTEFLNHFINVFNSSQFVNQFENNLYKEMKNSISESFFKHIVEYVLQSDKCDLKHNIESQIQVLNQQLIQVFNRLCDGFEVRSRITSKGFADRLGDRDETQVYDHKERVFRTTLEKSIQNSNEMIDPLLTISELRTQNTQLMNEMQSNEEQKRNIEKENSRLHYKCKVLSKLLSEISNES